METNWHSKDADGCELWHLDRHVVSELEKVQNITVRIMQGFLPGTTGSASRGLLG